MKIVVVEGRISYAVIAGKDIVVSDMSVEEYNRLGKHARNEGKSDELNGYNYCLEAENRVKYFFKAEEDVLPVMPEPIEEGEDETCEEEKSKSTKKQFKKHRAK